jgi:hypothetical protein
MADGKFWLKNVKSFLDKGQQFTDFMVGTLGKVLVQ